MTPVVSVLVIAGTARPYLTDALRSLVAQGMPDWEAIVVECCDESADSLTVDRHLAEVDDERVRVVRSYGHPTYPPYASRKWNLAALCADAPLVAFLDDDDMKEPNWLEAMCTPLLAAPDLGATVCGGTVIDDRGRRLGTAFGQPSLDLDDLRCAKFVTTGQLAVRRDIFDELGGFDEALGCSEDWDFCLRLARRPIRWRLVDSARCLKREGVGNAAGHPEASAHTQSALRYIVRKHGFADPDRCRGCGELLGAEHAQPFVRAVPGEGFQLWHHGGCSQRFFGES